MKPKIIQSKENGYCFGVRRAMDMIKHGYQSFKKPIYMLGDLVHNQTSVIELKKMGITKTDDCTKISSGTIIISAHGVSPKIKKIISLNKNLKIIDATCPMVKKAQSVAKQFKKEKRFIIIFGDRWHQEVKGLIGFAGNNSLATDHVKNTLLIPSQEKIGLLSQTTQDNKNFQELKTKLKKRFNNIKIIDTICQSSKARQKEAKSISQKSDIVIVIGSKKSANTKRLFEIASKINKNSFWINNAKDINKISSLCKKNTIGLIGGASTPIKEIKEISNKLLLSI